MSEYDEREYYPILVSCIRPKRVVPFDCFVLLSKVNRVVHWVKCREIFSQEKYEKLQTKNYSRIHIRIEDKSKYFAYLDAFLKTEIGQTVLKEIIREVGSGNQVEGIPNSTEYTLTSLDSNLLESPPPPESEPSLPVVASEPNDPFFDKSDVNREDDSLFFVKSNENLEEDSLGHQRIVELMNEKILDLKVKLSSKKEQDELHEQVIKEITQEINDEILKIKGLKDLSDQEDVKHTIKEVTERINEQLLKIKGGSFGDPEGFQVLYGSVRRIEREVAKVAQWESRTDFPKINDEDLINIVETVQSHSQHIRELVGPSHRTDISEAINLMIQDVEKEIGCKILLDPLSGVYKSPPDYMDSFYDLSSKSLVELLSNDDHGSTAKLKHLVYYQSQVIKQLESDLLATEKAFQILKDQWFLFHVQAKNRLDPLDLVTTKKIDAIVKAFEQIYKKLNRTHENLHRSSSMISDVFQLDQFSADSTLLSEIEHELNPSETSASPENKEDLEVDPTQTQVEESLSRQGSDEQLQSENKVLQVQVENLQSLLDSEGQKSGELRTLMDRSELYSKSLEEENRTQKSMIEQLTEKLEKLQSAESRYHETMSDSHKKILEIQSELASKKEEIQDLRTSISFHEKELDVLRKNEKWKELVEMKEKQNRDLQSSFEKSLTEAKEDRSQKLSLSTKLEQSKEQHKLLSQKMGRLSVQYENLKKKYRTIEVKTSVKEDLLEQSRLSLSKVTRIADTLKKEREKYIGKTNQLLKDYKLMMDKAKALNEKVAVDEQQLSRLQKETDSEKAKNNRQRDEIQEWKTKYSQEQVKIKTLSQDIRTLELKIQRLEAQLEQKKAV